MSKRYAVLGFSVVLALALAVPALGGPSNPIASISASVKQTANKALKQAKQAKNLANTANSNAKKAQETAEGAKAAADGAQATANGAKTTADGAKTTADGAKATADGVKATAEGLKTDGLEAGHALLRRAKDSGAGLVVMGAYGHSRLREFVFGGATSHVLAHLDRPVLVSH